MRRLFPSHNLSPLFFIILTILVVLYITNFVYHKVLNKSSHVHMFHEIIGNGSSSCCSQFPKSHKFIISNIFWRLLNIPFHFSYFYSAEELYWQKGHVMCSRRWGKHFIDKESVFRLRKFIPWWACEGR